MSYGRKIAKFCYHCAHSIKNIIFITAKNDEIVDSNEMAKQVCALYGIPFKLEKFDTVLKKLVSETNATVNEDNEHVELSVKVNGREAYFVMNESPICVDKEVIGKVIFLNDISFLKI